MKLFHALKIFHFYCKMLKNSNKKHRTTSLIKQVGISNNILQLYNLRKLKTDSITIGSISQCLKKLNILI